MITTGTKLLIGSAFVTALCAAAYGIFNGGTLGTIGLLSAAVGLLLVAIATVTFRDSNISSLDHDAFPSAAANQIGARPSLWPLLVGVGAVLVTVGLVTNAVYLVLGFGAMAAGGVEWMIQGWSERVSTDPRFNNLARRQLAQPLELPVGAAILAGVIAFSFSRIMLGLPSKEATVAAFAVVAALILAIGALIGLRRNITGPALAGVFAIGAVLVVAAGTAYGLSGPHAIEEHETTADLAVVNNCGPEETHADEKNSQSVAAKSNVAAEVYFDGEQLIATMPGSRQALYSLTLPRSNPSNVIFHNDSGEEARLVVELHPSAGATTPQRECTALVDDGGSQFLTVEFPRNTRAVEAETGEGLAFTVAGTDVALEVIVP